MRPFRILSLIALVVSSFYSFAHASNGCDKKKKKKTEKLSATCESISREDEERTVAEIPELLDKDQSYRYLSESESLPLVHEVDLEETERQRNPTNFMARIMARYRMDMGLTPALEHEPPSSSDEVMSFLACFGDKPQEFLTDAQSFDENEIVKAYSFFKYLGRIPLKPTFPDQCQEIMDKVGASSFDDILNVYKETRSAFTVINWDLLKLISFKHQYFPVTESMIKPFKFIHDVHGQPKLKRKHIKPPSLTCYGKAVLQRCVDKIRFLNPKKPEHRKILLYQRIYRRYSQALGRHANPYHIEWKNCIVENWPDTMSRSRILNWTEEDIILMNALIDDGLLRFSYSSCLTKGGSNNLGKLSKIGPDYYTDIKGITGDKDTCISDDENFGGEERIQFLERIKIARTMNEMNERAHKKKSKIERRVFEDNEITQRNTKFESESEDDQSPQKKQKVESDEEAEFDSDYGKKILAKSASKSARSSFKKAKSHRRKSFEAEESEYDDGVFNVKDNSSDPATPEARQKILDEMMIIFRKQTGKSDAIEIDWSLSKVHHLQNHLLPFSTNFETFGDIRTLENLIHSKSFRFLNLSKPADRKIRAYERLFAIYVQTTGKYRNEYDIEWNDVYFTGLPVGLNKSFLKWGKTAVEYIEAQLDDNAITCELTDDLKEEIAEVEAELNSKMSNEGTIELPDTPVSMTNGLNSVKSSDVEIGHTEETSSTSSAKNQPERKSMETWKFVISNEGELELKTPHFMSMINGENPSGSSIESRCPTICSQKCSEEGEVVKEKEYSGVNRNQYLIKDDTNLEEETKLCVDVEQTTANPKHVPFRNRGIIPLSEPSQISCSSTSANHSIDEDRVILFGQFAGNTVGQILAHQSSIQESISNYLQVRESFAERSRHRRLMNYIINCLELILDHARNFDNPEPRRMDIIEIHEYLDVFLNSLASLGSADEIRTTGELKKLVIAAVKFRARLAGAKISFVGKRKFFTIDASIIANDCFNFLAGPVNNWELAMLDHFIDGVEDIKVFKNN